MKSSLAAAAAAWSAPAIMRRALGANADIRVAVVGFHSHGQTHIANYLAMSGVRLVALCDADSKVLADAIAKHARPGQKIDGYTDIRQMLDRKDIDAISVATPNHWHALAAVWGCQAGKDVCVEKPVSHTIWEGRQIVRAARKYGRVVQGDLDMRSSPANWQAAEFLRSGKIGKPVLARGYCYKRRPSIGKAGPGGGKIPSSVDYNLWCGPAPKGPLPRVHLHYDWHWQWATGNGEIGNNGPHHLDLIRWLLGEAGLPRRVLSLGGRFGYEDDGQTPNTQIALYDYACCPVIYETRGLGSKAGDNHMGPFAATGPGGLKVADGFIDPHPTGVAPDNGAFILCQDGYLDMHNLAAFDRNHRKIIEFSKEGRRDPQSNFIAAVRSRKIEDLRTDILQGHLSSALCHMGNISYRLGRAADADAVRKRLAESADAPEAFARMIEHLSANRVDIAQTPATVGPWLTMDSAAERFTGPQADQANALLRREYREPFVIRDEV